MQQNEDYVLRVLQDVGLVSRKQIDAARKQLNGQDKVLDVLVKDGIVSESDVSRSLAAQAHMDWIDLSAMVIPPEIIRQDYKQQDCRGLPNANPMTICSAKYFLGLLSCRRSAHQERSK